jgi:O-antigen/teichoic acid export membrane protein
VNTDKAVTRPFGRPAGLLPRPNGDSWVGRSVRTARGAAALVRSPTIGALTDQAVVSITNFVTAVMVGRLCGRAELGAYALAWTLLTLSTECSGMLITTPYTVLSLRLSRGRRRRYLGSLLVHQVVLSATLAAVIVTVAGVGVGAAVLSRRVSNAMITAAIAVVFVSVKELARRVSFAELKISSALCLDVAACVLQVGGIWVLYEVRLLTAAGTFVALAFSSGIAAGVWLYVHRRTLRIETRLVASDLQRNWQFGRWVLGSGLVSLAARYLYPWVLAVFHGVSETGTWAACSTIVALGNPVILGLGNYMLPTLSTVYASAGGAALRRQVQRWSLIFSGLLLPIVLLLAVAGGRVLTGLYGTEYGGSSAVLLFLALNMLVSATTNPYSQGLFSLESARADTFVNVVWVAVLFAIGIPAVKWYGALGAAVSMVASTSVAAFLRVMVFENEVRRRRVQHAS